MSIQSDRARRDALLYGSASWIGVNSGERVTGGRRFAVDGTETADERRLNRKHTECRGKRRNKSKARWPGGGSKMVGGYMDGTTRVGPVMRAPGGGGEVAPYQRR